MCQEYIEDLNHLLSIAKHTKSIELLQSAITQERSLIREQTKCDTADSKPVEGAGATKQEARTYSTRITQYGNTWLYVIP